MQNFTSSSGKRPCPQLLPQFTFSFTTFTVPTSVLADFTCYCFAVLDYADWYIQKHSSVNVRKGANYILSLYSPKIAYTCDRHSEWGFRFSSKIIINVFTTTNKNSLLMLSGRKRLLTLRNDKEKNNICSMLFLCYLYILLGVYFAI